MVQTGEASRETGYRGELARVAELLWIVVSAARWRDRQPDNRFGVSWLLTMTGNIGVFIAGDLVSFHLVYALVSIPAYGLFAFSDDSRRCIKCGAIRRDP